MYLYWVIEDCGEPEAENDVNIFHESIFSSLFFGGKNITKYSCSFSQKALSLDKEIYLVSREVK